MLTDKQAGLLAVIADYAREHDGLSPTFDEMGVAMGLKSKAGIHRLLLGLEERGFIRRIPGRARAIEILRVADEGWRKETVLGHLRKARELLGEAKWKGDYEALIAAHAIDSAMKHLQNAFKEVAA